MWGRRGSQVRFFEGQGRGPSGSSSDWKCGVWGKTGSQVRFWEGQVRGPSRRKSGCTGRWREMGGSRKRSGNIGEMGWGVEAGGTRDRAE